MIELILLYNNAQMVTSLLSLFWDSVCLNFLWELFNY